MSLKPHTYSDGEVGLEIAFDPCSVDTPLYTPIAIDLCPRGTPIYTPRSSASTDALEPQAHGQAAPGEEISEIKHHGPAPAVIALPGPSAPLCAAGANNRSRLRARLTSGQEPLPVSL